MRRCVVILVAACGKDAAAPAPPIAAAPPAWSCEPLPFAASTPVPEASGAAWITRGDKPALFVLSDSGNQGAWGIVDPDTGDTVAQGALGRFDHGDDYEGVATRRGQMVAVLSGGYVITIRQDGDTFVGANHALPLGDKFAEAELVDHHGTRPPLGKAMVCGGPNGANCGRNFEGICLDDRTPFTPGPCAGFVASKADGHLYCLVEHDGNYTADYARSIEVSPAGTLADCAIDERGGLWAGANILGGNAVYRVDDWQDPSHARVVPVGNYGVGNAEVLAVRGDVVYRMSDTNNAPSLMAKFRCTPAAK